MRKEDVMRGKTDVMFGHKGSVSDPPVNLKVMAEYVGTDPETLRIWRKGKFPKALSIFARICKHRELDPKDVADLVKAFE